MAYALGIDVGTTFTAGAIWRDGRAEAFDLGTRTTGVPSVLFLRDDGVMLVGEAAEQRAVTEPARVAREFKRRFGDDIPVLLGDTWVTATELVADMIRFTIGKVSERESEAPGYVLLTCPATWSDHRRGLMEQAAGLAGLSQVGLLAEPTAAATYYAARERLAPGALVGVYDLGGGTFDATVLRKTTGGFELCGDPGGDDQIGGVDVDQAVLDHIARTVGAAWSEQDPADPATARALAAVHAAAVTAKETLSHDVRAEIPVILPSVNRVVPITRDDLEDSVRILALRTVDTFSRTVRAAGVAVPDLARILLVGGSSRIPLIAQTLERHLGVPVAVDAHPKLAVCLGAAIAAGARLTPVAPGRPLPEEHPDAPEPGPSTPIPPVPQPYPTAGSPVHLPTGPRSAEAAPAGPDPESISATIARRAADLVAPIGGPDGAAAPEPVRVDVDLAGAGLSMPADEPLRPAVLPVRPVRLVDRDIPLVVRTAGDETYRRASRGTAARLGVAVAILMVAAVAVGLLVGLGHGPDSAEPPGVPGQAEPPPSTVTVTSRVARLTGGPLAGAADLIGAGNAVIARPGGGMVVLGATGSADPQRRVPAAWSTTDTLTWKIVRLPRPADTSTGSANGVVALGTRLVAVGVVSVGDITRAAAWTSDDGRTWRAASVARAEGASMHDVSTGPAGLLAVGQDGGSDGGDGAVWSSSDGTTWTRVAVSGASGLGAQSLDRLVPPAAGTVLAVGQEPQGSGTIARFRRSADGVRWSEVETDLPVDAELTGLTRLPDGRLIGVGSVPVAGRRQPRGWVGDADGRRWEPQEALPTGVGIDLLGVGTFGDHPVAVGSVAGAAGPAVASWTVAIGQTRPR